MGAVATQEREARPARCFLAGLLFGYGLLWIWLAIEPVNRRDWLLENVLVVTGVALLLFTYRRFQFSLLSYGFMALFLVMHVVGAHYTYAEVPFGFWLKELFALERNPFDRIVHFAFGALLAYPMRELLLRLARVRGVWSSILSLSAILALSGLFEVVEAIVAMVVSPELGTLYLGTQGDVWDAQKDMAAAFFGALLTLGITHVRPKIQTPHAVARPP
jgi:putative membrane protein